MTTLLDQLCIGTILLSVEDNIIMQVALSASVQLQ